MVAAYSTLTANLGQKVKRISHGGRSYLVAPASLIVPGVLNGSDGPGYYPPEENTKNPSAWDGMPIVAYHPVTENGEPTSALTEHGKVDKVVYRRVGLGALRNSRGLDGGRLASEAWFDEEHVKAYDSKLLGNAKIYPRLLAEKPIELSTGLHVDKDVQNGTCPKTGKPYTWIARNHKPDHLAVLPDQRGACSVEDGCGIVVNQTPVTNSETPTVNPFVSEAQRRACYAKDDPDWDCKEWSDKTEGKLPEKKTMNSENWNGGDVKFTHSSNLLTLLDPWYVENRDWSQAKRDETPKKDFAGPHESFPITSQADVDAAAHLVGKASDPEAVKARIKAIAEKRGLSVPESWKKTENADTSEGKWVTLPNGVHVLIKDGEIVDGPEALVGKSKKDSDGETHESLIKKVDDIVKRINAHGALGRKGSKEVSAKLVEESKKMEDLAKEVTAKMSKDELAKAAGLSKTPSSWSQKKLAEMVYKNVRDRMGMSFRVHNEDATENAGKYGNPQHLESGKFLPHGSGTGKGEPHKAAVEGRHGKYVPLEQQEMTDPGDVKNDCGGGLAENCSQTSKVMNSDKGDRPMKLKTEERAGILTRLVANCGCSDEDAKVLNTLSDSALMSLNAMEADDESPMESTTEEAKKGEKKKVPPQFAKNREAHQRTTNNSETPTVNQEQIEMALAKSMGFNDAGHMKATLNVAKQVEFREREALLKKLVANVAKEKQESVWNAFKGKPIEELQAIVDLIPAPQPVRNANPLPFPTFPTFPTFPNFAGAAGYSDATNNAAGEQDLLDIPTMNWEKASA